MTLGLAIGMLLAGFVAAAVQLVADIAGGLPAR
jgi:hypothetical protein